jgi:hypothetical protein
MEILITTIEQVILDGSIFFHFVGKKHPGQALAAWSNGFIFACVIGREIESR